jgi:hypothetical protein
VKSAATLEVHMTHTPVLDRRRFLGGLGAAAVGAPLAVTPAHAADAPPAATGPVTVWGTSQDALPYRVADQTVRLAVRVSAG